MPEERDGSHGYQRRAGRERRLAEESRLVSIGEIWNLLSEKAVYAMIKECFLVLNQVFRMKGCNSGQLVVSV